MTIAILFGTFVIALIIGIPVSVSLGISAVVSFIYCDIPLVMISQKLYTGIDLNTERIFRLVSRA